MSFYATFTLLQWRTRLTTIYPAKKNKQRSMQSQFHSILFDFIYFYCSQSFDNKIISQNTLIGRERIDSTGCYGEQSSAIQRMFLVFFLHIGGFGVMGRLSWKIVQHFYCVVQKSASIPNLDSPHWHRHSNVITSVEQPTKLISFRSPHYVEFV